MVKTHNYNGSFLQIPFADKEQILTLSFNLSSAYGTNSILFSTSQLENEQLDEIL